ncbi:MAG: TonB-dependent receptor, partial [Calditrichia bacterium]
VPFLSVQLSYSYLEPDGLTALNPQNLFKYFVSTNWRKLKVTLYGKYVANLYAENYSTTKLDNYHIMNVSLSYPFRYLSLNFQLQNILNKKYEVLPAYPAPGFHFMAGITLNEEIF